MELSKVAELHYLSLVSDEKNAEKGVKVESTNIAKVGHDGNDQGWLVVKFHNGAIWAYHPVSTEGYHALVQAESHGSWFHKNIKTNKAISSFNLKRS